MVWPKIMGIRNMTSSGFQRMGISHFVGNKDNTCTHSSVTTNNVTCSICSPPGQVRENHSKNYRKDAWYQDFKKVLSFLTHETMSLCQRAWQKKVWLYAHSCRREVEWAAVSKVLAIPSEWVTKQQIIFNPSITHTYWITLIYLRPLMKEATGSL